MQPAANLVIANAVANLLLSIPRAPPHCSGAILQHCKESEQNYSRLKYGAVMGGPWPT